MMHHPSAAAIPAPRAKQLRRPLVLCIDDDPDITLSIEKLLSNFEVEVIRCIHGQQGIWDAVSRHPDLIITDLRMPYGNGEDLIACLRRNGRTRSIPIIVLSGQRGAHLEGRMKHMGADVFLRKPVPIATLLMMIGKYIELRELDHAFSVATAI
jgi:CheY-like chemotaxis protein